MPGQAAELNKGWAKGMRKSVSNDCTCCCSHGGFIFQQIVAISSSCSEWNRLPIAPRLELIDFSIEFMFRHRFNLLDSHRRFSCNDAYQVFGLHCIGISQFPFWFSPSNCSSPPENVSTNQVFARSAFLLPATLRPVQHLLRTNDLQHSLWLMAQIHKKSKHNAICITMRWCCEE